MTPEELCAGYLQRAHRVRSALREAVDGGDEKYKRALDQLDEALRNGGCQELHDALLDVSLATALYGDLLL